MNKLGFYIENTTVQHLRDALAKVKPPVILIHAGDRGLLREIRSDLSPDSFVIGRIFVDPPQQDAWLTGGDPEGAGRAFADRISQYDFQLAKERGANGRLLIDAWMGLNEPVKGPAAFVDWQPDAETLARYDALDRFQAAFLDRLQGEGLEGVAFSFAAGNFVAAGHVAPYFPRSLAAYTYLAFHEYGWPALMPRADTATAALLYREVMQGIRDRYGPRHTVIITEAGLARMYRHPQFPPGDVGWLYPGETVPEAQYWESLQWYNGEMGRDDYVLGACLYQVGHSGAWETFRHLGVDNAGKPILLIDKIATLGTAAPAPGPGETPIPPPEPADEREALLQRVAAVQAALGDAGALAHAFAADLGASRTALSRAREALGAGPAAGEIAGLLRRLDALGSAATSAAQTAEIAALRAQLNAALPAATALDGLRGALVREEARLAAQEGRRSAVEGTVASAGALLADAGVLEAEIRSKQAASLAVRPGLEAAGEPAAGVPTPGLEAGGWPASVPGAPRVEVIDATWVAPPPRARGSIRRIVVHHTGTRAGLTAAAAIRRQLSRGKGDGGYHYLVTRDGTIYQLNAPHTIVNQSRRNAVDRDAVAVALVGDFDLAAPSAAQLAVVAGLIAHLIVELGLPPDAVVGRSEVERGTTSPGLQWSQGVGYRVDLLALVRGTLGLR